MANRLTNKQLLALLDLLAEDNLSVDLELDETIVTAYARERGLGEAREPGRAFVPRKRA